MSAPYHSADLAVPFLGNKEKDFVLLDRPPNGPSKIVPANFIFGGRRVESFKNGVARIQNVIAAEVVGAAVEIVGPGFGDQSDYPSTCSAELGAITVRQDFEFLDRVKGGEHEQRAIRS